MKKLLFVLIILISVTGCCNLNNEIDIWNLIENKEFSNYEKWAGSGIYFYEDGKDYYLNYKIYGSGVPIIYTYTSKIVIKNSNEIEVYLPHDIEMSAIDNKEEIVKVNLIYKDGAIIFNNFIYK